MGIHVFTSISLNYLPKARALAMSLKKIHPNWIFHLLIADDLADSNLNSNKIIFNEDYFDRVTWIKDLKIDNIDQWVFKHNIVELCTAIKGIYLLQLMEEGIAKVIYLDPDIYVFNCLDMLPELLNDHAILLTPHLLDYPHNYQSIIDNEVMSVLRHGVFNLGFFAVNTEKYDGQAFTHWWKSRLTEYCYADFEHGLFTDQKWCDLIPSYFTDYYVIRDPGFNVASWNLEKRNISLSDNGQILVNEKYPLRFYHFTGYDSGIGKIMTQRYSSNALVNDIWSLYYRELEKHEQAIFERRKIYYNFYDNGIAVDEKARKIYRERKDLQDAFPNPYKTKDNAGKYAGGFYNWYNEHKPISS